jgi:hypothetical protein
VRARRHGGVKIFARQLCRPLRGGLLHGNEESECGGFRHNFLMKRLWRVRWIPVL